MHYSRGTRWRNDYTKSLRWTSFFLWWNWDFRSDVVTKTRNHAKPPTKPAKTTYKTNQNDPKPATIYPNTTGLCDICVDGRLRCCVTITLTIMHGIFSPLSRSSYWNYLKPSHEKSKRALSLKTGQQIYFCISNWCQVKTNNKFSSGDSDMTNNTKVLVSGPLLNTCTSIFDSFCQLTSLFRTQNGLDCT